jgi:hypothetical protein
VCSLVASSRMIPFDGSIACSRAPCSLLYMPVSSSLPRGRFIVSWHVASSWLPPQHGITIPTTFFSMPRFLVAASFQPVASHRHHPRSLRFLFRPDLIVQLPLQVCQTEFVSDLPCFPLLGSSLSCVFSCQRLPPQHGIARSRFPPLAIWVVCFPQQVFRTSRTSRCALRWL